MRKKSTVRQSMSHLIVERKKNKSVDRLKGRLLFKASVRLVLEYIDWLKQEKIIVKDEEITDEVPFIQAKKYNERDLSIQDRSILLINPQLRTKKDREYISDLMKKIQAFKKYPNERESIAEVCEYRYFGLDRIIVRQNHPANYLYYIINGNVELIKVESNNITEEIKEMNVGTLGPGDMFGEVALLHSVPRTTTVVAKTPVDLLCLHKSDFDRLLKVLLLENWNVLQDALVTFDYFKSWDKTTIRECCVLSKVKDFKPDEIILGDGKGMVNYVYFLLSGTCRLIEHMLISEEKSGGQIQYKLYDPKIHSTNKPRKCSDQKVDVNQPKSNILETDNTKTESIGESVSKNIQNLTSTERMSITTTTFQNIINQWHEITDLTTILRQEPSAYSQQIYPNNVKTIFVQVCEFHRSACFGLGEQMQNRRIVSVTHSRCLLIPRYWLSEHNHANIWERVKVFMNSKYPSREKLFNEFVTDRKWIKYKKSTASKIIKNGKNIYKNTTIHDVPYSIRISQIIDL
ncbi:uncharacterized protein [Chelonus insularis]|uniref:uncharacterized protein n=1 Tax=Chelonus insularis TaxID=460826 RepID=UPI00158A4338|nr:uncharacterized protein LOC118074691 [Chelonus insularis]